MTDKPHWNRRDLLRYGGLSAIALPVIAKAGDSAEDPLLDPEPEPEPGPEEEFGGFEIRELDPDDPFEVDEASFEFFHARDAIFSRMIWDEVLVERMNAIEQPFTIGDPGYDPLDVALAAGSACVALFGESYTPLMGRHGGLLSFDLDYMTPPTTPVFEGRWDPGLKGPDETARLIKKAGLFYGASMVGVAPLDPRFLYTGYYDPFGEGKIRITEVEEVVLPPGQISSTEAGKKVKEVLEQRSDEEIKEIVLDVLTNMDPSLKPPGAPPPALLKRFPPSQFRSKLSRFTQMPTPVLQVFMDKLDMDLDIALVDPGESARPRYLEDGTLAIPETMKTVVVLAFEMDGPGIDACPTTLGDVPTMDGYSKMGITAGSLSVFIRALGWNAIPCGNNTAMSVPQAIRAGLGEGGRNGILITPKYGPRVRLAKVITDMPMTPDKPISFGATEFCAACKKCAEHCPTQAISYGDKSTEPSTMSTQPGVLKWAVDAEKCYESWTANGSGCGVCIKVCPFNKPESWLHELTRVLIGAGSGTLDKLMVKLDDASGYGAPEPIFRFWDSDDFMHIKKG